MDNLWILAQTDQTESVSEVSAEPAGQQTEAVTVVDSNAAGQPTPARKSSPFSSLIFVGVIFVVMYLILFREPRKRQKQQQKMVQSLKKNDKVRTIGGILGTVVDIKGDEVTLKIDESNNTKIKVVVSSIGKNLSNEGQA